MKRVILKTIFVVIISKLLPYKYIEDQKVYEVILNLDTKFMMEVLENPLE